jgi:SOS-response transcriptional repressor LexA
MDARKRHRLSHAQVQMARELGMNPKKLGGIDNHRQEPWKAPLPEFIQHLYRKRFGRDMPLDVRPLEERAREAAAKKAARKAEKRAPREAE